MVLNKNLLKIFLKTLVLVVASLITIILIVTFLEQLTHIGDKIPVFDIFQLALFQVILLMPMLLPIMFLFATIAVIRNLQKHNEMTIIRGIGVSFWNIGKSWFVFALSFGIIWATLGDLMLVNTAKKQQKLFLEHKIDFVRNDQQRLFWFYEKHDDYQMIIYSKAIDFQDDKVEMLNLKIFIYPKINSRRDTVNFTVIVAKLATLQDFKITLEDGYKSNIDQVLVKFKDKILTTSLTPRKVQEEFMSPHLIPFFELPKTIKRLNEQGFSTRQYSAKFVGLLMFPVSLCIMIAIAMIATLSKWERNSSFIKRFLIATVSGLSIFFITQFFVSLGTIGLLTTFQAVVLPWFFTGIILLWIVLRLQEI
ncbi:MAG: LptF/LptG family permease [Alphaproteobacteria bacterium]|nr:LptF/LptG family permease [Alphaproteobacteria bacterium]